MSKIRKMPTLTLLACQHTSPEQKWNNSLRIHLLAKEKKNKCVCDPQNLLHATYLQAVSSSCWQAPVAYPRQLWVAQGLCSWRGFRECSPMASAASENHTKPCPLLAQLSRPHESTPHSHTASTKIGRAFKGSCWWVLVNAGMSSKMLRYVT